MIRCKPKGLCSWDFFLESDEHHASLEFNWWGEQGTIIADSTTFDVCKHGMLSEHWTLDRDGIQVVSAQKSSAFKRTFEMQSTQATLILRAESAFGRSFCIECFGEVIATIVPDHAFTRRATIQTSGQNRDFLTCCFAFWLVVLMWRRAASESS